MSLTILYYQNLNFFFLMVYAIKIIFKTYYQTVFENKINHLNTLMARFHVGFEIELSLDVGKHAQSIL